MGKIKVINLFRTETGDQGTFGLLVCPDWGMILSTAEPPERDNRRNISCIPDGDYRLKKYLSPKYNETLMVLDVPDRSNILFHSGNYAGDTLLGYSSDTDGCILLGKGKQTPSWAGGQTVVSESTRAIADFNSAVISATNTSIVLRIRWAMY